MTNLSLSCTRMKTREFEHIKSIIETRMTKTDTQFPEVISITERLAIT